MIVLPKVKRTCGSDVLCSVCRKNSKIVTITEEVIIYETLLVTSTKVHQIKDYTSTYALSNHAYYDSRVLGYR